jgi:hypothetical protein
LGWGGGSSSTYFQTRGHKVPKKSAFWFFVRGVFIFPLNLMGFFLFVFNKKKELMTNANIFCDFTVSRYKNVEM